MAPGRAASEGREDGPSTGRAVSEGRGDGEPASAIAVDTETLARVTALLYREALLLDQGRLRDWLALFHPEATYWVPLVASATSPDDQLNIVYDDLRLLEDRVYRLETGNAHSQDPPSAIVRGVSSVLVDRDPAGPLVAHSVFTLHESRPYATRILMGRYTHHLVETADGLLILRKRTDVAGAEGYLQMMSFLL